MESSGTSDDITIGTCRYCGCRLRSDRVKRHEASKCPAAPPPPRCPKCGSQVRSLKRHRRRCKGPSITCQYCGKKGQKRPHLLVCKKAHRTCPTCRERVHLNELEKHLPNCRRSWRTCPTCGEKVHVDGFGRHRTITCEQREVGCPHCGEKMLHSASARHISTCHARPRPPPPSSSKRVSRIGTRCVRCGHEIRPGDRPNAHACLVGGGPGHGKARARCRFCGMPATQGADTCYGCRG